MNTDHEASRKIFETNGSRVLRDYEAPPINITNPINTQSNPLQYTTIPTSHTAYVGNPGIQRNDPLNEFMYSYDYQHAQLMNNHFNTLLPNETHHLYTNLMPMSYFMNQNSNMQMPVSRRDLPVYTPRNKPEIYERDDRVRPEPRSSYKERKHERETHKQEYREVQEPKTIKETVDKKEPVSKPELPDMNLLLTLKVIDPDFDIVT